MIGFAERLSFIMGDLPSELACPDEVANIISHSQRLPSRISSPLFCFECPLAHDSRWLDWGFLIETREERCKHFRENLVKSELMQCQKWKSLYSMMKRSAEVELFKRYSLDAIAVGFDSGSIRDGKFEPNLFVAKEVMKRSPDLDLVQLLKEVSQISEEEISSKMEATLAKIRGQCMRYQIALSHFGFMFKREMQGFRLSMISPKNFAPRNFFEALRAMGLPNLKRDVLKFLDILYPLFWKFEIGLDVGEEMGKRVGIKCYLLPLEAGKTRWNEVLSVLQQQGWVSPDRKAALEKWQGGLVLNTDSFPQLYKKSLHHVKFIYQEGEVSEIKAYLRVEALNPQNSL